MVIKEKELARLMKDAYRGGGYTVAVRGNGKTVICTNAWAVEIDDASLPREALSMMALHMGFLPEPDEAFTIYKGNKEPTVQTKDFDVAVQCITQLDALLKEAEARKARVRKTVLTYNGYSIWQQGNGNILLIDPAREQLLYHDKVLCKCRVYGLTHSKATDWAGRWMACGAFNRAISRKPLVREVVPERKRKEAGNTPIDGQISLEELK